MKIFLALQISTATEPLVIKMIELHGVPSDFVLISDNICTQMRVQGYCGRWLVDTWKAVALDVFNHREIKVPEKAALNLIESFKLRHLLVEKDLHVATNDWQAAVCDYTDIIFIFSLDHVCCFPDNP